VISVVLSILLLIAYSCYFKFKKKSWSWWFTLIHLSVFMCAICGAYFFCRTKRYFQPNYSWYYYSQLSGLGYGLYPFAYSRLLRIRKFYGTRHPFGWALLRNCIILSMFRFIVFDASHHPGELMFSLVIIMRISHKEEKSGGTCSVAFGAIGTSVFLLSIGMIMLIIILLWATSLYWFRPYGYVV